MLLGPGFSHFCFVFFGLGFTFKSFRNILPILIRPAFASPVVVKLSACLERFVYILFIFYDIEYFLKHPLQPDSTLYRVSVCYDYFVFRLKGGVTKGPQILIIGVAGAVLAYVVPALGFK